MSELGMMSKMMTIWQLNHVLITNCSRGSIYLGECSNCGAKIKISQCKGKHVGRVLLEDSKGNVTRFYEVIQQIHFSGINASIYGQLFIMPLLFTFSISSGSVLVSPSSKPSLPFTLHMLSRETDNQ